MRHLLLGLSTFALAGCVSLVPPATKLPPRYTLTAQDAGAVGPDLPVTLAIADARAEGAYNTAKIAVLTGENELRYLSEGEWSDRAPRIFSLLLERSFEERGQLLAVSDRVALPIANYVLYSDMQSFNVDRTGGDTLADVSFRVRLENRRGQTIGAKRFEGQAPLEGTETRDAALAINRAASEAAAETAAWALSLIEAEETEQGSLARR